MLLLFQLALTLFTNQKGYQNKKKKKELANALEKLSKPGWKSSDKLGSVAQSREIHQQQPPHPQESDVSNLSVHQRRKSLVVNSIKPKPNDERIKKSTSVYDGNNIIFLNFVKPYCTW